MKTTYSHLFDGDHCAVTLLAEIGRADTSTITALAHTDRGNVIVGHVAFPDLAAMRVISLVRDNASNGSDTLTDLEFWSPMMGGRISKINKDILNQVEEGSFA